MDFRTTESKYVWFLNLILLSVNGASWPNELRLEAHSIFNMNKSMQNRSITTTRHQTNKRSQKQDSNKDCTAARWKYEWKSLWRWCVEAQSRFVVHVTTCLRFANTCSFVATSRGCAILVWTLLLLWPSVFWCLLVLMAQFVVTCSGDHCASFETQLVRSTSSVN